MGVFVLTVLIIGIAMLVMSVGVLFSNRCLNGSCGGSETIGPDGERLTCAACPHTRVDGASEGLPRPV